MISVRECASFAGLTAKEICLGASPSAKHRVLQSRYLLNLWRGSKTVRKLIVADIRRWTELGAPDRAADALLVLRQFLSDFPDARIAVASLSSGTPRTRSREPRQQRNQSRSRRRARFNATETSCPVLRTSSEDEVQAEEPGSAVRNPVSWRET